MGFRPRFSLRMFFVLVAIAAVPMGWVAYQLNWIRQRHQFLQKPGVFCSGGSWNIPVVRPPWSLRLFGETSIRGYLGFPNELADEAERLYPEFFTPQFYQRYKEMPTVRPEL